MEKKQLSETVIFIMIFVALLCDAFQAMIGWIPIAGNILADLFSIAIFLTFFLWFKMHGISMLTPKRLRALVVGGAVEMIPFINILPAWTGVVIYLIGTTKIKEIAEKHPALARAAIKVGGKIKNMNKNSEPLNVPLVD